MQALINILYFLILGTGVFSFSAYAQVSQLRQELNRLHCGLIQKKNIFTENFYAYDYEETTQSSSYILNKSEITNTTAYKIVAKKNDLLNYQFILRKKNKKLDLHWLLLYNPQLPKNTIIKNNSLSFKQELKELGLHQLFLVQKNPKNLNCFVSVVDTFFVTDNPSYPNTKTKLFNKAVSCYQTYANKEKNQICKQLPSLEDLYHLKQIQAPKAWQLSRGQGVRVGLVDSGINYLHPYLQNQFVDFKNNKGSYDFEFNDPFAFDDFGHGTAMAGFISSAFGVAPDATLISFKINPSNINTIIQAFKAAIKNKVHIINFSLSYLKSFKISKAELVSLQQVLDDLLKNDILVLQAAGNQNQDLDLKINESFFFQFDYPNWLRVAAYNKNFYRSSYSNYSKKFVDIVAPGGSRANPLLSTFVNNEQDILLAYGHGTSQATAIASGLAALVRSYRPHLSATEVKYILLNSGPKALPEVSKSGRILNAWDALNFK